MALSILLSNKTNQNIARGSKRFLIFTFGEMDVLAVWSRDNGLSTLVSHETGSWLPKLSTTWGKQHNIHIQTRQLLYVMTCIYFVYGQRHI